VKSSSLFKRSIDTRKVPCVFIGIEAIHTILRSKDPSIVGESTLGIGARIGVDQLTCRGDSDLRGDEGKVFGVFYEIEKMRVRAGEFVLTMYAKGVVPNDPIARMKADLLRFAI
jgi:hypothetical protein